MYSKFERKNNDLNFFYRLIMHTLSILINHLNWLLHIRLSMEKRFFVDDKIQGQNSQNKD